MLSCLVNNNHDNWDDLLGDVVLAYNNNIHSSTGFAPNEMVFGRVLETSVDRQLNVENQPKENQEMIQEKANVNLDKARAKQQNTYEKTVRDKLVFKVNDFVVLENTKKVVGHVKSFEPRQMDYIFMLY